MDHVVSIETVGIAEDVGCCLEWDAMLLESSDAIRE
jgi:hypothetical protein